MLLEAVPDLPRWLESRGMLLSGSCELFGSDRAGFVVRSSDDRLISSIGRPAPAAIEEATASLEGPWTFICQTTDAVRFARELRGWTLEGAVLHMQPRGANVTARPVEAKIEQLKSIPERLLDRLPPHLRRELPLAARRRPVVTATIDRRPAAFCYSLLETETLWDVSVETLREFRRRGLAEACAARLIKTQRAAGKEPVWGAVESNAASIRLAEKLGFAPVDRLAVFELQS